MKSETIKILRQLGVIRLGGGRDGNAVIWLFLIVLIMMIGIVSTDYFSSKALSEKGKFAPFSEGLFKNEISGVIGAIKINRSSAEIFLHYNGFKNNKEIKFYPDEQSGENDFFKIVQGGDSLWKYANSNVIYTIGKDSVKREWHFSTIDKYGKKYAN